MTVPKCFISYSWETPEHQAWVLALATRLRENGVEAWLDKFETRLGHDLAAFMERSVREADYVLLVCTPTFAAKANDGRGGVGYEKQIVTGEIFGGAKPEKFVPVLRQGDADAALPSYLKSRLFIDFRDEGAFAARFEELLRHIFGDPLHKAPPVGRRPNFEAATPRVAQTPQRSAGIVDLFSESFDSSEGDLFTSKGHRWFTGLDGVWTISIADGRYVWSNREDANAIHYSHIGLTLDGGAPIDFVDAKLSVRVRLRGQDPDPYSGAGLLIDFDRQTRFYGAFFLTQTEREVVGPPHLTWAVRDQRGLCVQRSEPAEWLTWERDVGLAVKLREHELELLAGGRSFLRAPRGAWRGRDLGLFAIGRGDFAFDDLRARSGV